MRHYMKLSEGTLIEAHLKSELPKHIVHDATYESMRTGVKSRSNKPTISHTDKAELDLFLKYARRLIEQGDKILADSRMFLTPLPIRNGLAYIGPSGMGNPTLGIYIEWWRNNECAWAEDRVGTKHPLYALAGSPMSGCNMCCYVGSDDKGHSVSVPHFARVWRSFSKLNTYYAEAKQLYEAYTLAEVIEKLFREDND